MGDRPRKSPASLGNHGKWATDDIWSSSEALASYGVEVATPNDYPPADGFTAGPLRLTFDNAPCRLFYRLAVQDRNGVHWEDPKIYDDGSQ